MGIALVRSDAAIDVLVGEVERAAEPRAEAALAALAMHRHDAKVVARTRAAVQARGSDSLMAAFGAHLGARS
jgi:hypothetical protein